MITTKDRTYIKDLCYDNAEDFLHDISYGGKLFRLFDDNFIFRGHSSDKYKLISLVQRTNPYFDKYGYNEDIPEKLFVFIHTEFSQAYNELIFLRNVTKINCTFRKLEECEKQNLGIFKGLNLC